MDRRIVCENIRSAYNVGNIIRTADACGWGVVISGYTPSPVTQPKVVKTSLGAEINVPIVDFSDQVWDIDPAYYRAKNQDYMCIVAECLPNAIMLDEFCPFIDGGIWKIDSRIFAGCAVWVGNEVTGVEKCTIERADYCIQIPMKGHKSSLNVGQAAAILMWELGREKKTLTT